MLKRPYDIPPLNALQSFEAAARRASFKEGAAELNVTPAAISHQVKALERDLGAQLFTRHHRGVELTETGAYLFVTLQRGFEGIHDAVAQLRARPSSGAVTIGATTAVSSLWLAPRLAQFWRIHGDISVAQMVSEDPRTNADCDIGIHYGQMPNEDGRTRRLFHDRIVALASPAFAQAHPISSVADLARLPLVHLDGANPGWTDWLGWFRALGHDAALQDTHRVNNYVIALQCARDDMGAVLGWDGLTGSLVQSNALVQLLPDAVVPAEDFYAQLSPRASGKARVLFDWLTAD